MQNVESAKSASKITRPYSKASAPNNLTAEVLDRYLKITWTTPSDKGGYTIDIYDLISQILLDHGLLLMTLLRDRILKPRENTKGYY